MWVMCLFFGLIVGLSLGLTGGGGAVFAVPLMVYGLGIAPRDAVGLSLVVVGLTAAVGFMHRWFHGEVGPRTGAIFAFAGMCGAPIGVWISGRLPEPLLLALFASLMVVVACQLWRHAGASPRNPADGEPATRLNKCTFQRDASGRLKLTQRSVIGLLLLGLTTGTISGMFGVGGGFIIVPALVLITHMPIQRAVGTSLMIMTLVCLSGVTSHLAAGQNISFAIAYPFALGGIIGLFAGQKIGHRLPHAVLQRGVAIIILTVASLVLLRSYAAILA